MKYIPMMMFECLLCGRNDESDDHQKYDVKPYLGGKKSYSNWGNVPGLIYGNTRAQRDKNGNWRKELFEKYGFMNNNGDDIIYEKWKSEFKKQ